MAMIFLGAGTSKSTYDIPLMTELQYNFSDSLKADDDQSIIEFYDELMENLTSSYEELNLDEEVDIEAVLTVLEDLSSAETFKKRWRHPSILNTLKSVDQLEILNNYLCKMDCDLASRTGKLLKSYVVRRCDISGKGANDDIYTEFFDLVLAKKGLVFKEFVNDPHSDANFSIFTTNYDICLEEYFRKKSHGYENGELRTRSGELIVDLTVGNTSLHGGSTSGAKIFKLHGSINWYKVRKRSGVFWTDQPSTLADTHETRYGVKDHEVVIYPIIGKEGRREPFSDVFSHLRQELLTNDSWFVAGYSFRDREIRDLFIDCIRRKDRLSKTTVFLIDPRADEIAKDRLSEASVVPINKEFDLDGLRCAREEIEG
jgi:hypothetical protein